MSNAFKVTAAYATFGILWIVVTDHWLFRMTDQTDLLTLWQIGKGWLYVAGSSVLIYALTRIALRRQRQLEERRNAVFHKTVEASQHILRNYLNQMQLLRMEAERHPGFDRNALEVADRITEEARAALDRVQAVENISPEHIHEAVFEERRTTGDR